MSMTGLEVFDTTVQKTNEWLHELMERLATANKRKAYDALRAVLQSLRDRLTVDEVAHLGAQLPMLVRGIYYEGWDPSPTRKLPRRREDFLLRIGSKLAGNEPVDPEEAALAVFSLLGHRASDGEIEDVKGMLPQEIRDLWPQPAAKLV